MEERLSPGLLTPQSGPQWDTSTWQQLAVLTGHTNGVYGIAISPNGRILASASWDNTAQLWNLDSGRPIALPLQHPDWVLCVSFSTDGTLLATSCHDHNAYTWDIPAIMEEARLEELDVDRSFLHVDSTRRPVQQPKNPRVISTGFFSTTSNIPDGDSHLTPPISPPAVLEGPSPIPLLVSEDAPPNVEQQSSPEQSRLHFCKWFHNNTSARPAFLQRAKLFFIKQPQTHDKARAIAVAEDVPPDVQPNSPEQARPTFPQLARLPSFDPPQRHDDVESVPPIVYVPLVVGNPRYHLLVQERARQKREKENAKQARLAKKLKNPKDVATTSQLLSPGNINVPLVVGNPRCHLLAQERARQKREKENAKQARLAEELKNPKDVATTSQLLSPGNITQPADQSHVQSSSEPHLAASSTTPANAISAPATVSATPVSIQSLYRPDV